jgi:hypothetical protein
MRGDLSPTTGSSAKEIKTAAVSVLVLRLEVDASLSSLPVVGPKIPPDLDVRLDGLQVVLGSKLTSKQSDQINSAIRATDPELPTVPADGTPGGPLVGVRVVLGKAVPRPLLVPLTKPSLAYVSDESASNSPPEPTAGGTAPIAWMDIERTLGPVRVDRLGVSYADGHIWLLVAAALSASGITIGVEGLGLGFALRKKVDIEGRLDGLAVGFSRPPVTIAGALVDENAG